MTKDILVRVRGTQTIGEEEDTVEMITPGTYYDKNGKQYFIYDESLDETGEPTHNTVKIMENRIEVTKRGLVDSHMIFEPGKRTTANYRTPMGLFLMGITTSFLEIAEDEESILLKIKYSMEMNGQYGQIIEKKAENMYRTINQKIASFPASNKVMRQKVTIPKAINLTPQETEQLSEYVSDDTFVQRQKEDIQELTSMFRDMLDNSGTDNEQEYLEEFRKVFVPQPGFEARYVINIEEKKNPLWIAIGSGALECGYGETEKPDVEMQMNRAAMEDIVNGRMTFQRAFMSGIMKRMKGDFRILRTLDQMFPFEENNR